MKSHFRRISSRAIWLWTPAGAGMFLTPSRYTTLGNGSSVVDIGMKLVSTASTETWGRQNSKGLHAKDTLFEIGEVA